MLADALERAFVVVMTEAAVLDWVWPAVTVFVTVTVFAEQGRPGRFCRRIWSWCPDPVSAVVKPAIADATRAVAAMMVLDFIMKRMREAVCAGVE